MSDFWGAVMALLVFLVPLWLAWVLLGRGELRKPPKAVPRGADKHRH